MGKKLIENGCLSDDRGAFIQYLLDMGYSKKSLETYEWVIKRLGLFMGEHNQEKYTREVAETFLENFEESSVHMPKTIKMVKCVLRRFNCFMEQDEFVFVMSRCNKKTPLQFIEGFEKYINNLKLIGRKDASIKRKHDIIQEALIKFNGEGIQSFSDVKPEVIYDVFEKTNDKPNFGSHMREFLYFLFENGIIDSDYSLIIPSVRKPQPIPSVYTKDEMRKFLATKPLKKALSVVTKRWRIKLSGRFPTRPTRLRRRIPIWRPPMRPPLPRLF